MYSLETEYLAIKIAGIPNYDIVAEKYRELYNLLLKYQEDDKKYLTNYEAEEEIVEANWKVMYNSLLDVIDFITDNQKILYNIRSLKAFNAIDIILTHWKRIVADSDLILHLRKCSNWIRRKY